MAIAVVCAVDVLPPDAVISVVAAVVAVDCFDVSVLMTQICTSLS